jgi:exo-beta-1,3-glucanase (GH17 family)
MDFDKGLKLSRERIDKDLELLSQYTQCIRTYSTLGLEMIPELARKHGLTMWLGAWVSGDPLLTRKEIDAMVSLAKANTDIVETVVVGNEALLRREVSATQLVGYIQEVKKELPSMKVTYADVWEFWNQHPSVAPAVDRVTIHILPYWEDKPIAVEIALLHVKNIYEQMKRTFSNKEVVIGETGWPSFGRMREAAGPSAVNQALFTRSFVKIAEQQGWKYNFIEAFDQPWKRMSEGAVGGYWGLFDADRVDKHVLHGFVTNYPNALWLFLGSFLLTLTALRSLLKHTECRCQKSPFLLLTLFGGASALAWQVNSYLFTARSLYETMWALLCLSVAFFWWYKFIRGLITEEKEPHGNLARAIALLFRHSSWQVQHSLNDIFHLLAVSIMLIMALGMAFDGRYHNFDMGIVSILAISYTGRLFHVHEKESNGLLERTSGLALFASGISVLLAEGLRNDTALIWVAAMVLFGIMLSCFKLRLKAFIQPFGVLVLSGIAFVLLKEHIYVKESLIDMCAANPTLTICQIRAILGKVVYLNLIGFSGLGVALLAMVSRNYWLGLLAMVMGVFCLLTFNGFVGAIVLVMGWWVVGFIATQHKATV